MAAALLVCIQGLGGAWAESVVTSNEPANAPATAPAETASLQAMLPHSERQDYTLKLASTFILDTQPGFPAAYSGANSLLPGDTVRETFSFDIYFADRLWQGGELYFNPEYYQGYGFADTHGVAAFPNGEAYKVGVRDGDIFLPHFFFRQTFGLGGEQEKVEEDLLHMGGSQDVNRITVTFGRFSVADVFDDNSYSHDSRNQFMNWALIDGGAFDFAADSLGFTQGLAVDYNTKDWALRWGTFLVPRVSNGLAIDSHVFEAWQQILEYERRYTLWGHPGKARLLGWVMRAHMGSYADTLNTPGDGVDITLTERYRLQEGVELNLEQELTKDVGAFMRASWRDGHSEVWAFTDIDRSLSTGLSIQGKLWNRDNDNVGLAYVISGLSPSHEAFLAAGGLGPLIGDGALNYGYEQVFEAYYSLQIVKGLHFTVDYQLVANPAFNRDRGPINFIAGRLHWEF